MAGMRSGSKLSKRKQKNSGSANDKATNASKNGGKPAGKAPQSSPKGIWPVTYKWVAVGTLVAYTALGSQRITLAHAQQPQATPKNNPQQGRNSAAANSAAADSSTHNFTIPAGLLEDVLPAFENASGLHVVVTNAGIAKLQSPGVSGEFTNQQALAHLLEGSGAAFRFAGPDLVRLELSSVQQDVTVNGSSLALDQVSSGKYTSPLLDTPQSVSVVPQQVMAEQNTTTLRDALRNIAGISLAAGEGSSQGDNLTIRGFTARNDIFLDGIRDFGSYYRDTFDQEEVQVLEGPSAVTFGRGTTGGVVNEVSKSPEMNRFISGNTTFGSGLTRRISADINEPLPQLGSGAAFRLNLMGDDNKVADRDSSEYRRYGFAPSLAFGLDGPTRVVISYFHQSENDTPDYGIPWLFNAPAPIARNNYYGFEDANFLRTNDDIVTAKVEHDVSSHITLRNVVRYANEGRNAQITEPQIPICAVPPATPAPGCVTPATPLSSIMINRNEINVDSIETMLDDQLDTTFRFNTGSLKHTVVTGVEAVRETSDLTRDTITGVPTTSLLNPNESQPYAGTSTPASNVQVTATTVGLYALDTLELGSKFEIVGGGRWDRFDANYNQSIAPTSAFSQIENLPTWRGAFVYKPRTNGSVYFDAGNSFNPSAESLSLSAANANTPPEKNLTYEVGTKWDLAAGKVTVNGSLFRTDKTNAREPDPNNPLQNVLGGNERVDGAQISISGYITSRWELLSSYALLDGTVVSSVFYPLSGGEPLANVPKNTFNFWSTYKLPWRQMQVGGGGNFVDKRDASSTVPFDPTTGLLKQVPGYWVFNAMAKYPLGERASIQLNLNNLTNKYYYDQIHPAHIVPGAGFTALVGINFRF